MKKTEKERENIENSYRYFEQRESGQRKRERENIDLSDGVLSQKKFELNPAESHI